jgi:mRNA-degrading endonuclease RelE of RelBE toxin-antitoxin system
MEKVLLSLAAARQKEGFSEEEAEALIDWVEDTIIAYKCVEMVFSGEFGINWSPEQKSGVFCKTDKGVEWVSRTGLDDEIQKTWNPDYQPEPKESRLVSAPPEPEIHREAPSGAPAEPEIEWSVGLTLTFRKSIKGVDKAQRARILTAIVELCDAPITRKGDTIKPLTGDSDGLWRYRIGDYRLLYQPETREKKIILVFFASRGSAYSD